MVEVNISGDHGAAMGGSGVNRSAQKGDFGLINLVKPGIFGGHMHVGEDLQP